MKKLFTLYFIILIVGATREEKDLSNQDEVITKKLAYSKDCEPQCIEKATQP